MILTRAPLRISYIGGGSDFTDFTNAHEGNVVGATIDQFVYISINPLSDMASENIRFTYRKTESVNEILELQHPVLRELALELQMNERVNIATFSDLPAGVGLGGSSSFTAALIKAIFELRKVEISETAIADLAIKVERGRLMENGGLQDQYHASIGGFRHYMFKKDEVIFSKELLPQASLDYLQERQLLVWSGETRDSKVPAAVTQLHAIESNKHMIELSRLAKETSNELVHSKSEKDHFDILENAVRIGWEYKQDLTLKHSHSVSTIVKAAVEHGAGAVKLCGAGGSGFVLVLAETDKLPAITKSLSGFKFISPRFVNTGVSTLLNI
jgi:D-glycero-alpha-D-manno-heptose-7-phosphate kinase